jgi:ribosomal subunit interface protein
MRGVLGFINVVDLHQNEEFIMRFQFTFKQMHTSEALTLHAETKLRTEIEKFVTKPVDCQVTFSVDRYNHTAHLSFNGGDGYMFQVEHTCDDMYASVNHLVDKLEVQLRRHKEKLKDHKNKRPSKGGAILKAIDGYADNSEIDAADILRYEAARRRQAG